MPAGPYELEVSRSELGNEKREVLAVAGQKCRGRRDALARRHPGVRVSAAGNDAEPPDADPYRGIDRR